jgi:hypothetical protein
MVELSALSALLFALTCGALAVKHSCVVGRVTLLDWTLLGAGGGYGLGWVVVVYTTISGDNPTWAPWILPYKSLYLLHTACAVLLISGVLVGWNLRGSFYRQDSESHDADADSLSKWSTALWLCLAVALFSQVIYAKAYGGLSAQLDYSAAIRAGVFQNVPENAFSFLSPISKLAFVACFGFFGLLLSYTLRLQLLLGFCLAAALSFYVLYNSLWRLGIGAFLLTLIVTVLFAKHKSVLTHIAFLAVLGPSLLLALDALSNAMELKPSETTVAFIANELSFPFGSFFAQFEEGPNLFRGFIDVLLLPVYLLPSSIWGHLIETCDQANTAVIMGAAKGESDVTAGIPVDIITLGLMQAHIGGIVVVGGLFGWLLALLQGLLDKIHITGIRIAFEVNIGILVAAAGLFYAQPNLLVEQNVHWLVAGVVISGVFFLLKRANNARRTTGR